MFQKFYTFKHEDCSLIQHHLTSLNKKYVSILEHTAQYLQIRVGALPVPRGVASNSRSPDVRRTETSAIRLWSVRSGLSPRPRQPATLSLDHQTGAAGAAGLCKPVRSNTAPNIRLQRCRGTTCIAIPDRVKLCMLGVLSAPASTSISGLPGSQRLRFSRGNG